MTSSDGATRGNSQSAVYVLEFYRDFHCMNCGRCCRTPWQIKVEDATQRKLTRVIQKGKIASRAHEAPFVKDHDDWILNRAADGECAFHRNSLCVIHKEMGTDFLPIICQVYPRLCVIQPSGIYLSPSFYCESARQLLFGSSAGIAIERNPPAFPRTAIYGGLDAREHMPPLLMPDVPMTWQTYRAWESHAVDFMAREDFTPGEALIVLATSAEKLRQQGGSLSADSMKEMLATEMQVDGLTMRGQLAQLPSGLPHAFALAQELRNLAVSPDYDENPPHPHATSDDFINVYAHYVEPGWHHFQMPLRRYLAARLFANFFAYQGDGLRSGLFSAACALALVRVEAAALCRQEQRDLDERILGQAISRADGLLLHRTNRRDAGQFFNRAEYAPLMASIQSIP